MSDEDDWPAGTKPIDHDKLRAHRKETGGRAYSSEEHVPGSARTPICGVCKKDIYGEEVRIRHPAAPNPMHRECAETWKPGGI
jgi:hypothetical protein